jgi:hypothetical protein
MESPPHNSVRSCPSSFLTLEDAVRALVNREGHHTGGQSSKIFVPTTKAAGARTSERICNNAAIGTLDGSWCALIWKTSVQNSLVKEPSQEPNALYICHSFALKQD